MRKKLFEIFFFLFIFTMINRECTPFGVDLRLFCLLVAVVLGVLAISNHQKFEYDKRTKWITIFYGITIISNVMWRFNSLPINKESFEVIIFSYIYNFICYLIFLIYKDYITWEKYKKHLFFSLNILVLSMAYEMFIGGLDKTFLSTYSGKGLDISPNFLGGKYRVSGFAQDPNYTSLFLFIGVFTSFRQFKITKKLYHLLMPIIYVIFYMVAASKTVLIALIPIFFIMLLPSKYDKWISKILLIAIILTPILIVFLNIPVFKTVTMNQRINFWNNARDLFFKSPIIGNGLTSFRSYFDSMFSGWYVQCHSTVFQLLSENGVLALLVFSYLLLMNLNEKKKYVIILTILYSIFMVNTETLYHAYSIFFIGILPLIMKGENEDEKN